MVISLKSAGSMSWKSEQGISNRNILYRNLSITRPVHCLLQEHTRTVYPVSQHTAKEPPVFSGDGLYSPEPSEILAVTIADCMPIFLLNMKTRGSSLLHSGWKGTGILKTAVGLMVDDGADIDDIAVLFGPHIGGCCYAVDNERFQVFSGLWGPAAVRRHNGRYFLSLLNANIAVAKELGLKNWYTWSPCTCCNKEYGSFRREGSEKFTSMLALAGYFQ